MISLGSYLFYVILPLLSLAAIIVFIRLLKGPGIPNRVVAFDLLIIIGLSAMAIYSMLAGQSSILDIAMVMALIGFLTIVAFSYYLEKRERND
jgi:multicomponent Na+:H+ antiporter subunit F